MMITYEPLRLLLVKRKIKTAKELAELLGIAQGTAGRLLNDVPVSIDVIDKACATFGVPVEEIMQYKENAAEE